MPATKVHLACAAFSPSFAVMTEPTDPLFAAKLTPHRSLGRNGFIVLMVSISAICFVAGVLFYAIGAWPIMGFFGLDVLLIYLAFKLNYRSGRAYEQVVLTTDELQVHQVTPRGQVTSHSFNPFWVRLLVDRTEDEGVTGLKLTSHGKDLQIGSFLNPDDRESFADALSQALRSARAVPTG